VSILEGLLVWSFGYLALRRLLEPLVLRGRSRDVKAVQILVLRTSSRSCAADSREQGSRPRTEACSRR
jgi:hypothetical protein